MKYHFEFGILYTKKTKYYLYVNVFTMIVHIILNIYLIKNYGLWGALFSSLAAVSLNTGLIYLVSQKLYKINFDLMHSLLIISSGVAIYYTSIYPLFQGMAITIFYKTILLLMFLPSLYLLGVLRRDELFQFRGWVFSKLGYVK